MVVDDHAVVRSGLTAFLQAIDDLELVGEAADGREAVQLAERIRPDVILMDLYMPVMDGLAATRAIVGAYPHVRIIILTSFVEERIIQSALEAGCPLYTSPSPRDSTRSRMPSSA